MSHALAHVLDLDPFDVLRALFGPCADFLVPALSARAAAQKSRGEKAERQCAPEKERAVALGEPLDRPHDLLGVLVSCALREALDLVGSFLDITPERTPLVLELCSRIP